MRLHISPSLRRVEQITYRRTRVQSEGLSNAIHEITATEVVVLGKQFQNGLLAIFKEPEKNPDLFRDLMAAKVTPEDILNAEFFFTPSNEVKPHMCACMLTDDNDQKILSFAQRLPSRIDYGDYHLPSLAGKIGNDPSTR